MQKGDVVKYRGKVYVVLNVVGEYVGLVDPDRDQIIDDTNGQLCAHIAVKRGELDG